MAILDGNGRPIPKVTAVPKEGHDLVECNFLVSDLKKVEGSPMVLMTPKGPMPVPLEQVLSQIAKNLYSVLSHLGQKQVIFSIEDKSSQFVKEKQLAVNVMEIKLRNEETTKDNEGTDSESGPLAGETES